MSTSERDRFRSLIGNSLGIAPNRVTLFARGRVAFYAILRALEIGPGDEVILPAFTCVAVPNAVFYAGARPVWADIDPSTYCLDPQAAAEAVTSRTRAILAQNTYGLSADLVAIMRFAGPDEITVIDDCTHGLGGTYRGKPNGATAPLSFFSTQWSKPISTGLGGFAVDPDGATAERLRALEAAASEPSRIRVATIQTLVRARRTAGSGRLFRGGRAAYRALSRLNFVPASSSSDELAGARMPPNFLTTLSEEQARIGSQELSRLPSAVEDRRTIAHRYSDWLVSHGRTAAAEPPDRQHAFLRYPIRVVDRSRFIAAARHNQVDLGDWFVSPVHPARDRLERWGYVAGSAPMAERACQEVVNLPTDPALRNNGIDRVFSFLCDHLDLIQ